VDYAGKLPTPVAVVEGAFDLAERAVTSPRKLVDAQRQRAGKVIDKAASVLRSANDAKPAADAKSEVKTDAKAEVKAEAKTEKTEAKAAAKPAAKPAAPKPAAKAAAAK
jgi:hypothetical protein